MPPAPVSSKADFHLAGEIKPLTSLRFIAASFVLLHHLQGVLFIPKGSFDGFQLGNAVSFFFVLSGFILTCSYQSRIASIRYRDFLLVRFARIWPAHIAVLLLCVFWLVPAGFEKQMAKLSTIELGQIIFLLQSWTPDRAVFWGLNAPAWTISVELFFYACFPLLILGLRNYRWKTLIGMALILIAYFWAVDSFASFPDPFTSFGYGEAMPLIRLPEFMLGILLGQSLLNSPRLQEWAATPSKTLWTIIEIGVLAAMIWANAYGLKVGAQIKGMLGEVTGIWAAAIFPSPFYALAIAVFFLSRGYLANFLSLRIFVWLGTISFAEYLIHQPMIYFWRREMDKFMPNEAVSIVGFAGLVIITSAAIYYLVEKPGLSAAKTWVKRRSHKTTPAE